MDSSTAIIPQLPAEIQVNPNMGGFGLEVGDEAGTYVHSAHFQSGIWVVQQYMVISPDGSIIFYHPGLALRFQKVGDVCKLLEVWALEKMPEVKLKRDKYGVAYGLKEVLGKDTANEIFNLFWSIHDQTREYWGWLEAQKRAAFEPVLKQRYEREKAIEDQIRRLQAELEESRNMPKSLGPTWIAQ